MAMERAMSTTHKPFLSIGAAGGDSQVTGVNSKQAERTAPNWMIGVRQSVRPMQF
jgi:hypothetical protein